MTGQAVRTSMSATPLLTAMMLEALRVARLALPALTRSRMEVVTMRGMLTVIVVLHLRPVTVVVTKAIALTRPFEVACKVSPGLE